MKRLLALITFALLVSPAHAVGFIAEFNFGSTPPATPFDVVFGVLPRPTLAVPHPAVIESFAIPATGLAFDLHINNTNAATYGIDWPLWVSGFSYPAAPNIFIEAQGMRHETEVYATLDVIDDVHVTFLPSGLNPARWVGMSITGSGTVPPGDPPVLFPEPTGSVLLLVGLCHLALGRFRRSL